MLLFWPSLCASIGLYLHAVNTLWDSSRRLFFYGRRRQPFICYIVLLTISARIFAARSFKGVCYSESLSRLTLKDYSSVCCT
jgi:hypothetical protein